MGTPCRSHHSNVPHCAVRDERYRPGAVCCVSLDRLDHASLSGDRRLPAADARAGRAEERVCHSFELLGRQETGGAAIVLPNCRVNLGGQPECRTQDLGRLDGLAFGAADHPVQVHGPGQPTQSPGSGSTGR